MKKPFDPDHVSAQYKRIIQVKRGAKAATMPDLELPMEKQQKEVLTQVTVTFAWRPEAIEGGFWLCDKAFRRRAYQQLLSINGFYEYHAMQVFDQLGVSLNKGKSHQHASVSTPWQSLVKTAGQFELPTMCEDYLKLRSGFLYLFKDTRLQQEIKVDDEGLFHLVDLSAEAGNDKRNKASSMGMSQCLLELGEYDIAFSPVQWGWNRIEYYGGLSPCIKLKPKAATQVHRQQQFATRGGIDAYTQRFGKAYVVKQNATALPTGRIESVPQQGKLNGVLTFFIPDPLRMVVEMATDLEWCVGELIHSVQSVNRTPHHRLAILLNKLYFGLYAQQTGSGQIELEKVRLEAVIRSGDQSGYVPMPMTRAMGLYYDSQLLNHQMINSVLRSEQRYQQRFCCRYLQWIMLRFLEKENTAVSCSMITAMIDTLTCATEDYGGRYAFLLGVYQYLLSDPSCFDSVLDGFPDYMQGEGPADWIAYPPGRIALTRLFSSFHPLYPCLFLPEHPTDQTNDGSGRFRPEDYRINYNVAKLKDVQSLVSQPREYAKINFMSDMRRGAKGLFLNRDLLTGSIVAINGFDWVITTWLGLANIATTVSTSIPSQSIELSLTLGLQDHRTRYQTLILAMMKATDPEHDLPVVLKRPSTHVTEFHVLGLAASKRIHIDAKYNFFYVHETAQVEPSTLAKLCLSKPGLGAMLMLFQLWNAVDAAQLVMHSSDKQYEAAISFVWIVQNTTTTLGELLDCSMDGLHVLTSIGVVAPITLFAFSLYDLLCKSQSNKQLLDALSHSLDAFSGSMAALADENAVSQFTRQSMMRAMGIALTEESIFVEVAALFSVIASVIGGVIFVVEEGVAFYQHYKDAVKAEKQHQEIVKVLKAGPFGENGSDKGEGYEVLVRLLRA